MPRTKLTKAGAANKRARENLSELDDILRDFDIEFESSLQVLRKTHQQNLKDADIDIENFKKELGTSVLKLTMRELKKLNNLSEANQLQTRNELNHTVKENLNKTSDEGYLTEKVSNRSRLTSDSEQEMKNKSIHKPKTSTIAPLKSFKSRRRSQSVSNLPLSMPMHSTPGPRALMSQMKMKTPLAKTTTTTTTTTSTNQEMQTGMTSVHASRAKYRTPLQCNSKQRAASADRVKSIVPKVNPMTPISILRHARAGEIAFSVTGSPIVPSSIVEQTANVNIPVANGVLSIRPQNMDPSHLNTSLINKFDNNTIDHLRTLKNNLDLLMSKFEKRKEHH